MIFTHIAPKPVLRNFVRDYLIAHFRFDHEKPAPLKPYAPKPEQGITFFVRGRPRSVNPLTGEVQTAPPVSIFGQQHRRCDVHLASEFLMLRVHFQPGALFRLLKVPLYEYGENYFDAELVLNGEARDVSERLSTARSYDEMVALIEEYLVRRVRKAKHMCAEPRNDGAPKRRVWIREKIRSGQLVDRTRKRVQHDVHQQEAEPESLCERPVAPDR